MKLSREQQKSLAAEWQKYQSAVSAGVALNTGQQERYERLKDYFAKTAQRYDELIDRALSPERDALMLSAPNPPPPHLIFVDDFTELYASGLLPQPTATGFQSFVQPSQDASMNAVMPLTDDFISSPRRVKVAHRVEGNVRGIVDAFSVGDLDIVVRLDEKDERRIPSEDIAWISVYRPTGAQALPMPDTKYRIQFPDGRKMVGASNDYDPDKAFFSFILPAGQSQYERLIVNARFIKDLEPV